MLGNTSSVSMDDDMSGCFRTTYGLLDIEHRSFSGSISKDLARCIYSRMFDGDIGIVTDGPLALFCSIRKEWLVLIRRAYCDRARVFGDKRLEIERVIDRMEGFVFSTDDPSGDVIANVHLSCVDRFRLFPPICNTLIITCSVSVLDMHLLTSWMPHGGLVIVYDK